MKVIKDPDTGLIIPYHLSPEFQSTLTRVFTESMKRYDQRLVVSSIPCFQFYELWYAALGNVLDIYSRASRVIKFIEVAGRTIHCAMPGVVEDVLYLQQHGVRLMTYGNVIELSVIDREKTTDLAVSKELLSIAKGHVSVILSGQLESYEKLYDTKYADLDRLIQVSIKYNGLVEQIVEALLNNSLTIDGYIDLARRVDV